MEDLWWEGWCVFQQQCPLPGCSGDSRQKGSKRGGMQVTSQERAADIPVRADGGRDKWGAGDTVGIGQVWNVLWN